MKTLRLYISLEGTTREERSLDRGTNIYELRNRVFMQYVGDNTEQQKRSIHRHWLLIDKLYLPSA